MKPFYTEMEHLQFWNMVHHNYISTYSTLQCLTFVQVAHTQELETHLVFQSVKPFLYFSKMLVDLDATGKAEVRRLWTCCVVWRFIAWVIFEATEIMTKKLSISWVGSVATGFPCWYGFVGLVLEADFFSLAWAARIFLSSSLFSARSSARYSSTASQPASDLSANFTSLFYD